MPKVRTKRTRVPPGFELLEETLDALERRMREVESAPHEGKRRNESIWPVFRIHHQRSRFIFDMHYTRGAIDRACFDFCVKEGYADAALCAKWRKPGFMNLCCMTCVPLSRRGPRGRNVSLRSPLSRPPPTLRYPGAFQQRRTITARFAFAEYRARTSTRAKFLNARTAAAVAALTATRARRRRCRRLSPVHLRRRMALLQVTSHMAVALGLVGPMLVAMVRAVERALVRAV